MNFFKLKNADDEHDIVKFVSIKLWLRLLSLFFASSMLFVNISSIKDGNYSIVAIVFGIIFLLISLYENAWTFNLSTQKAIQKKGLIFFFKKREINFSAIHSVNIDTFKRPARLSSFTQIDIKLLDGERILIDRDTTKSLKEQIIGMTEVQRIIKKENEKVAEDFFNAVVDDILKD